MAGGPFLALANDVQSRHMPKKTLFASLTLGLLIAFPALAADTQPPTLGELNPKTVTAGVANYFSSQYLDEGSGGVNFCRLNIDGNIAWTGSKLPTNSTFGTTGVIESLSLGTHYLQFQCVDNAGNWGYGPMTQVSAVTAGDVTPPNTGDVYLSTDTPKAGGSAKFYVNANDASGIRSCHLIFNGTDVGEMPLESSGSYALQRTFPAATYDVSHSVRAKCTDSVGNESYSANVKNFTVLGSQAVYPVVGTIQPTTATKGVSTRLSASVSGQVSVCSLYVGGYNHGYMTVSGGYASVDYIFTDTSKLVRAECISPTGGVANGADVLVNVTSGPQPVTDIPYGSLVKLSCPAGAASDDPCKAVYYFGNDGKRHPFPNGKIFLTWYSNFNNVREISAAQMSALPLGSAVRYRPGVRMVKFTTLPKVYAVAGNGTLRWVTTEELAKKFYTENWNQQIDDIPDTFYTDYRFGADIADVSQYNPVGETNMAPSID